MDTTFALNVNGTFYAATVRRQFLATRAEHPNTQAWGRRKAPTRVGRRLLHLRSPGRSAPAPWRVWQCSGRDRALRQRSPVALVATSNAVTMLQRNSTTSRPDTVSLGGRRFAASRTLPAC
jgi:hypothetical protein